MASVSIPLMFRELTGGVRRAEVEGRTVAEIVAGLERQFPGLAARVCDGQGFTPIVRVTVDGRIAPGLAAPVGPGSEVCLLPSMGGG